MLISRHPQVVHTLVRLAAIATAMLMLTVLIVTRSQAAFSATTDNTGNTFASGSVVLTDDDLGATMFTASGMTPGVPVIECIELTYSGTLTPADIRMYGTSSGALAPYLDTTIELGTLGVFGDCSSFAAGPTLFTGTLDAFSTAHTDWTSGLATFTAPANPTVQSLRFTIDVQNVAAAQTQSGGADFTWEAQD